MQYNYIKPEDIDWKWEYNGKNKSHKLTLIYLPTNQSVSGSINDGKLSKKELIDAKHDLKEDLREQLENLVC